MNLPGKTARVGDVLSNCGRRTVQDMDGDLTTEAVVLVECGRYAKKQHVGTARRNPEHTGSARAPEVVIVEATRLVFLRSFEGRCPVDDCGIVVELRCRPATEDEAAEFLAAENAERAKKAKAEADFEALRVRVLARRKALGMDIGDRRKPGRSGPVAAPGRGVKPPQG